MQYDEQKAITPFLLPSESVLWTGKPPAGFLLRKTDAFAIPFSLVWGGFAFFWMYMAYSGGAPEFFIAFGGLFALFGLYLIFGRFFLDMFVRSRTIYALTDQRVLILTGISGKSMKAMSLKNVPEVNLDLSNDRSGTITFGPLPFSTGMNRPLSGVMRPLQFAFEKIPNAGDVYNMIQSAQNKTSASK